MMKLKQTMPCAIRCAGGGQSTEIRPINNITIAFYQLRQVYHIRN